MNVLLIFGGKSAEHDISIITGCLARGYIPEQHKLTVCYFDEGNRAFFVDKEISPKLHKQTKFKSRLIFGTGDGCVYILKGKRLVKSIKIDVALNCCHGVNGEDGAVAGILQMAGIANSESGLSGSGVAIDKILTKYVCRALRIPVLRGVTVDAKNSLEENVKLIRKKLRFPVIVKPSTLGSSIGIAVAENDEQLKENLQTAFSFDNRVLAEHALSDFFELNCSAMRVDGEVLTSKIEKPISSNEILTFSDKYLSSGQKGFSLKTDEVDTTHFGKIEKYTKLIYESLNLNGVIRVDFLVDKNLDKVFLNEVNTIPGSLAYGMWADRFSKKQFGELLLKNGVSSFENRERLHFRFSSNVLAKTEFRKK